MLKTDDSDVHSFHDAWLGAAGLRIAGGTDEILKTLSPSVFWGYLRILALIRAWLLRIFPLENKRRTVLIRDSSKGTVKFGGEPNQS